MVRDACACRSWRIRRWAQGRPAAALAGAGGGGAAAWRDAGAGRDRLGAAACAIVISIPKAADPAHVRENAAAADIVLTAEDLAEIDAAHRAAAHGSSGWICCSALHGDGDPVRCCRHGGRSPSTSLLHVGEESRGCRPRPSLGQALRRHDVVSVAFKSQQLRVRVES